jgi:activator of HSP90 ATPase
MSNKNGLTGVQQFIISTLTNAFQDNSNRSVSEKLARAAITSIPESININTADVYNKVANQYPSLELSKTNQPKDVLDMSRMATQNVIDNDTQLRTVAYYIKK